MIEIRVVAGAQNPAELAGRIGRQLRKLAEDSSVSPSQLVVLHQPP